MFNVNPFEAEVPNEYDEVNLKEGQFKRNYYVIPESKEKIPVNISRIKTTTEKPENDITWKNYSNIEKRPLITAIMIQKTFLGPCDVVTNKKHKGQSIYGLL